MTEFSTLICAFYAAESGYIRLMCWWQDQRDRHHQFVGDRV